jgi:hypothetical protein
MAVDLFDSLKNAKGYATRENAQRKLDKVGDAIPKNATTFTIFRPSDGKWLAVVIHRPGLTMNIPYLCSNGICITN